MASQLDDPSNAQEWGWNEQCLLLLDRLINHTISEGDFLSTCRPKALLTTNQIILAVVLVLLLLATAGGNMLVIIAILIVKKLRSPTNLLIVNLAVTDFLVSILVLPFAIAYQILGYWPFNQVICDLYSTSDVLLCTLSILSLCTISIDRYLAITRPLQYAAKRTPKWMLMMILISWLFSAAISIPPVFGWEKRKSPFYCGYSEELAYQIYATMTAFYIPLTVMLVLYGKIFVLAKQMALTDAQMSTHRGSVASQMHTSDSPDATRNSMFPQDGSYSRMEYLSGSSIQENGRNFLGTENYNSRNLSAVNIKPSSVRRPIGDRMSGTHHTKACSIFAFPKRSSDNLARNGRSSATGVSKIFRGFSKPSLQFLRRRRGTSQSASSQKSETHKAVTTLGVIMGCFTICWLPFFVSQLITPIINRFSKEKFSIPRTLFQVFVWLGYGNSFLNPIIYALFNREFRLPFLYILRFQCASINTRLRTENFAHEFGIPPRGSVSYGYSSVRRNTKGIQSRRRKRLAPRRVSPLLPTNEQPPATLTRISTERATPMLPPEQSETFQAATPPSVSQTTTQVEIPASVTVVDPSACVLIPDDCPTKSPDTTV